ncbi:COG1361 S-layer family protein [Methanococcoides orientis]|uniref:COG1361 S-layer family protein n=1 Tax=Methanococcoides orientis TaxID=2822137 RepID=UPI001E2F91D5|nr:COG1361 S-layer family protein [Methanococcoides orientis]UGV41550.1 COG1361 S-layer family protein [Methanococcoides orientis]
MKKILILLMLLALPVATASAATYTSAPGVSVDVMSQSPNPARPGETVELTVSVQNIGNEDLAGVKVEIEPEYPFSEVSGESLSETITFLDARQDEEDAAILRFTLNVDPNATEGFYDLDITVNEGNSATKTTTVDVEVRGMEYAQVLINEAIIDRAVEETLEFTVTNTGSSPLKNMAISWDEPNGEILPVYSDNTKFISYLETGESATVTYSVIADVNADPGLYQLDICLEFEDYDSNVNEINTKAGIFVGGETDFDVAFSEGNAGEVSLSVANIGNNEAYSVKVIIPEQENYKVIGSSASIVGNLDKGDYTITSFTIVNNDLATNSEEIDKSSINRDEMDPEEIETLRQSQSSQNELTVVIEYTDSTGQRISVEKSVPIELMSATGDGTASGNRATKNSSSTSNYLLYLTVLAVVAGGAMYYRKKKASKGKDDEVQDIS